MSTEQGASFIIKVILLLAVIVIMYFIVAIFILPTQKRLETSQQIESLCPDWRNLYACSESSAYSLSVKGTNPPITLAQLCESYFNKKFNEAWKNCKELCRICPNGIYPTKQE